jgi:hypothetical protein
MDGGGGGLCVIAITAGVQRAVYRVQQDLTLDTVAARGCFASSDVDTDIEIGFDGGGGITFVVRWETHHVGCARDLHEALVCGIHGRVTHQENINAGNTRREVRQERSEGARQLGARER